MIIDFEGAHASEGPEVHASLALYQSAPEVRYGKLRSQTAFNPIFPEGYVTLVLFYFKITFLLR